MKLFLPILILMVACVGPAENEELKEESKKEPLNILWITFEDISPYLASYGDSTAQTPVFDRIARESVRFSNAYTAAGVCAPSRSAIITGMHPMSIGTQHMRTGRDWGGEGPSEYNDRDLVDSEGSPVPEYSAVVPENVKCFPEYLRKAGYFCTNNAKTDYQFAPPMTAWDQCNGEAHWKNRPTDTPFFSVFNLHVTHESRIWVKKKDSLLIDPLRVPIPENFPNSPMVRQDVARNYSNIVELDGQIGALLSQLEEDGLLDKTIIFFFSDHGGPLPRGKREVIDPGLHVPLFVRFPNAENGGTVNNDLVSFVDLAPTMLSLTGIPIPDYLQGQAFLGDAKSKTPRKYIYAGRDRLDMLYDRVRSVRSNEFYFVKNFSPELPNYMDVAYRKQMDMMNELLKMNEEGQLVGKQKVWFEKTKNEEEFYKVDGDPLQLDNLIGSEEYSKEIAEMREVMEQWLTKVGDLSELPEAQMIESMWPNMEQPVSDGPEFIRQDNMISLECTTDGSSIAYQFSNEKAPSMEWKDWKVYDQPIAVDSSKFLFTKSVRIGFKDSEIEKIEL